VEEKIIIKRSFLLVRESKLFGHREQNQYKGFLNNGLTTADAER